MTYKIGSLFDGSGGFPLAGSLCGITPAWASEVEPYPIAVTRSRFPGMKHLGDISKINGAEVEPVDIITFGSPCQDLSVAGKRAGLKHEANGDDETTRSGLFMEAVRIIKEMREATNGRYPAYALWENVPGAFSSNKGEDFRIVLEELIKIVEPGAVMPAVPKNGWPYADSYVGEGWSLSYRTFDAQHWGVPQRRRRIHLVLDLRGECAGEVLFELEGLRGYFATGRTAWQETASYAEGGAGADDRAGEIYAVDQGGGKSGANFHKDLSPTLTCTHGGEPAVAYTLKIRSGCEGGGKGALVQTDKSATRATNNDQYLFQPVPNILLDDQGGQQINVRTDDKCPTLRAEAHGNVPAVVEQYLFENHSQDTRYKGPMDVCPMLPAQLGTGGNNTPFVVEQNVFCKSARARSADDATTWKEGVVANTLNTFDLGETRCNELVVESAPYYVDTTHADDVARVDDVVAPLQARDYKGGKLICQPVYCLQGNGIDRADTAGCNGKGWKEDICYTLNTIDRPAVAYLASGKTAPGTLMASMADKQCLGDQEAFSGDYHIIEERDAYGVDCRNMNEYPELYPTMQAKPNGGQSRNFSGAVSVRYIVRRLTPTECARLQGFPDKWGHPDSKEDFTEEEYRFWMEVRNTHATVIGGREAKEYTKEQMLTWYNKLHTDSAEYKMWGNGIALPPALYCMQGIREALDAEQETSATEVEPMVIEERTAQVFDVAMEEIEPTAQTAKKEMTRSELVSAYAKLYKHRDHLTRQQIRTLKGQIKSGDVDGAMIGLKKLLKREGL